MRHRIQYLFLALGLFLAVSCSSSANLGQVIAGNGQSPVTGVQVVGTTVVPPTAELVSVPGQPLPLIVTKFRGVGN